MVKMAQKALKKPCKFIAKSALAPQGAQKPQIHQKFIFAHFRTFRASGAPGRKSAKSAKKQKMSEKTRFGPKKHWKKL